MWTAKGDRSVDETAFWIMLTAKLYRGNDLVWGWLVLHPLNKIALHGVESSREAAQITCDRYVRDLSGMRPSLTGQLERACGSLFNLAVGFLKFRDEHPELPLEEQDAAVAAQDAGHKHLHIRTTLTQERQDLERFAQRCAAQELELLLLEDLLWELQLELYDSADVMLHSVIVDGVWYRRDWVYCEARELRLKPATPEQLQAARTLVEWHVEAFGVPCPLIFENEAAWHSASN